VYGILWRWSGRREDTRWLQQGDVPLCSPLDVYGDMSHRGSCLKHGNFNCELAEQHLTVLLAFSSTARVIHLFKTQWNENIRQFGNTFTYCEPQTYWILCSELNCRLQWSESKNNLLRLFFVSFTTCGYRPNSGVLWKWLAVRHKSAARNTRPCSKQSLFLEKNSPSFKLPPMFVRRNVSHSALHEFKNLS